MRAARWILGAAALAALLWLPAVASGYVLYLANLTMVFAILALGLNLLMGEAGQFGIAHVAFYGIGIYTAATLTNRLGLPIFACVLGGALLAAAIGFVLGAVALRMRDIYLALATFAFGEAMQWTFRSWDAVTNGPNGMRIAPAHIFGFRLVSDADAFYFVVAAALLFIALSSRIVRSRLGRAFHAVRESEPAAHAVGVPVRLTKVVAFALSAFYAGAAGGVFTMFNSYIHPDSLGFTTTILVLTMVVVGGLGSTAGPVVGAIVLGLVSELLRQAPSWQELIYGGILIGFVLFAPRGVHGVLRDAFARRAG